MNALPRKRDFKAKYHTCRQADGSCATNLRWARALATSAIGHFLVFCIFGVFGAATWYAIGQGVRISEALRLAVLTICLDAGALTPFALPAAILGLRNAANEICGRASALAKR